MKQVFILVFTILLSFSCSTTNNQILPVQDEAPPRAKNVILLIGDGMGLTQISAGIYANNNQSNFERFDVIGIHKPYSSNQLVTDSAAGATAFSCGVKTYNGAIGVDADTVAITTILEEAESRGLSSGLIATSSIVHATPASFIAHNSSRRNYEQIAQEFLNTEIDFFVGGGRKHFDSRSMDERDLLEELRAKGYQISSYFENDYSEVKVKPQQNFGFLTSSEEPLRFSEGRNYLTKAVQDGMQHLSNHDDTGFFLMIEGSQIDWGGHANDFNWVISEWKEFDQAIGHVLDWAEKDGETLVIVTADHETGGLAIQPQSTMTNLIAEFTSDYHTGVLIPVFAYGPGSELFGGIYENIAIYDKMRRAFDW